MNNILISIIPYLFFINLCSISPPLYSNTVDWLHLSNGTLKISVDKKTGRYLIYDLINAKNGVSDLASIVFPAQYLSKSSEIVSEDKSYSSILGTYPEVLNYTSFNIDGEVVIFGSSIGTWISEPFIQDNTIQSTWRLGSLDFMQSITLTKSVDSQEDAILIKYTVRNNADHGKRTIASRIVLHPTGSDGQVPMFYLPDKTPVLNEYTITRSNLPSYWINADENGDITWLSIKGVLRSPEIITPNKVYLTSLEKVLLDSWEYKSQRKRSLRNQHSAVVLYFDEKKLLSQSIELIASTMITIPSNQDQFIDKGLEVSVNTLIRKNTTPINIDVWVRATDNHVFDEVSLNLSVPYNLEILDNPIKKINDLGPSPYSIPISWTLEVKEWNSSNPATILVQGSQNGICISEFQIPLELFIDSEYKKTNQDTLNQAIKTANNIDQTYISNRNQVVLDQLQVDDYLGASLGNLSELYRYLKSINPSNNKDLIRMIETEQDLIREIQDSDRTIFKINQEYQILLEVYQRLYSDQKRQHNDSTYLKLDMIDIANSLQDSDNQLKKQEKIFIDFEENITNY